MIQLYYYPEKASLAPHLVLEEMGLEFELVLVDTESNAHKSSEYLALNPAGRIPTLVDDKLVIFESSAICLYLCDKHPDLLLMPDITHADRARAYQWLMYLNNTVQTEFLVYFYPENHTTDKNIIASIVAAQESRLTDMFQLLDQALGGRPFLVGNHVTVCDYFLLMLSKWGEELTKPPLSFHNLRPYLKSLARREAVQTVFKNENLSLVDFQ